MSLFTSVLHLSFFAPFLRTSNPLRYNIDVIFTSCKTPFTDKDLKVV